LFLGEIVRYARHITGRLIAIAFNMTKTLTPLALAVLLAAWPLSDRIDAAQGRSRGGQEQASPRGGRQARPSQPRTERVQRAPSSDRDRAQAARRGRQRPRAERADDGRRGHRVGRDGRRGDGNRTVIRSGRVRRYYPYGAGALGLGYWYYNPYAWYGADNIRGHGYRDQVDRAWDDLGSIRLDIDGPRDARVLVDGYYAGRLDDFDGRFQALKMESGPYRIEVIAPGFAPLSFNVRVQRDRKLTLKGHMRTAR
jgi:hypothetical protein